jgi:hypothetical protein
VRHVESLTFKNVCGHTFMSKADVLRARQPEQARHMVGWLMVCVPPGSVGSKTPGKGFIRKSVQEWIFYIKVHIYRCRLYQGTRSKGVASPVQSQAGQFHGLLSLRQRSLQWEVC